MTIEQVRKELKDVKLYYSRKDFIDKAVEDDVVHRIKANVKKYDRLVLDVPENMYEVYLSIYHNGRSQEKASLELSYSLRNVERLHKELLIFFSNNS